MAWEKMTLDAHDAYMEYQHRFGRLILAGCEVICAERNTTAITEEMIATAWERLMGKDENTS